MQRLLVIVVVAACTGHGQLPVGTDAPDTVEPPAGDPWNQAVDRLVQARCHGECGQPAADCDASTIAEMDQARAELDDAHEASCITCMTSLVGLFESAHQPDCSPDSQNTAFADCDAEVSNETVVLHACNGHPTF